MLVMDSGLGGLSVVRALRTQAPARAITYLADTDYFPYGGRDPETLTARAATLIELLAAHTRIGTVVLACNTLSTLSLAHLRSMLLHPFVGTVPAIKVAAVLSQTKRFSLLATPNTASSVYTQDLVMQFAQGCTVDAIAAPDLAMLAERILLGETVAREQLHKAVRPAFLDDAMGRTDTVVLGCTHYPLILDQLQAAAPWPVEWVDSAEAIARRALSLVTEERPPDQAIAYVTREEDIARYTPVFLREGFTAVKALR